MITFFGTLIRFFFNAFWSKRIILSENALLKKENDILPRRVGKKRVHFNIYDKLFFVVLNRAGDFGTAVARPKILRKSLVDK